MSFRRRLKSKRIPEGFDRIEEVIEDFEQQMREAVNEEHEGKRKNETTWKIHRLHWEKNRFVYDLMYVRKVMSKELYDFLVREKIADGALISKWRKPGYEILCSLLAIQKGNHNFGTTSHCRVPMRLRAPQQRITPDVQTGCICCASGDGRFGGPIWWNTPMEDTEEAVEQNRAVWVQEDEGEEQEQQQQHGKTGANTSDGVPNEYGSTPNATETEQGTEDGRAEPGSGPQVVDHRQSRKRNIEEISRTEAERGGEEDDEDELPEEVKKRLAALRGDV